MCAILFSAEPSSADETGGVVAGIEIADHDARAGIGGVNELVVANVDAGVRCAGGRRVGALEQNNVARLEICAADVGAVAELIVGGASDPDAEVLGDVPGQTGAVKAGGRGGAGVGVLVAEELLGIGGDAVSEIGAVAAAEHGE